MAASHISATCLTACLTTCLTASLTMSLIQATASVCRETAGQYHACNASLTTSFKIKLPRSIRPSTACLVQNRRPPPKSARNTLPTRSRIHQPLDQNLNRICLPFECLRKNFPRVDVPGLRKCLEIGTRNCETSTDHLRPNTILYDCTLPLNWQDSRVGPRSPIRVLPECDCAGHAEVFPRLLAPGAPHRPASTRTLEERSN